MEILTDELLDKYLNLQPVSIEKHLKRIKMTGNTDFGYHITSSVVFSSMIEGNTMDLDSYSKISSSGMDKKNKQFVEIEDLIIAYNFASINKLNFRNLIKINGIMSKHIIEDKKYRGQFRDKNVFIYSKGLKIYTGAEPNIISMEIEKLGQKAWFIQSEKFYQKKLRAYYKNLDIEESYNSLILNKSLDFLVMLPMALRIK